MGGSSTTNCANTTVPERILAISSILSQWGLVWGIRLRHNRARQAHRLRWQPISEGPRSMASKSKKSTSVPKPAKAKPVKPTAAKPKAVTAGKAKAGAGRTIEVKASKVKKMTKPAAPKTPLGG